MRSEGVYTSSLVDAGQPAKWGKLQIEADVPAGCKVLMACRSGNVKDINDKSFSKWTQAEGSYRPCADGLSRKQVLLSINLCLEAATAK